MFEKTQMNFMMKMRTSKQTHIAIELDEFYSMHQKLSTTYDMKALLKKCVKMESQETC